MKKNLLKAISLFVLLTVVTSFILTGCAAKSPDGSQGGAATADGEKTQAPKTYKIGVCAADLSNPYFIKIVNGIKERAGELGGFEILVDDPKQDVAKQVAAVENFISQDVDAIIMIAFEPNSIESYLKDAREKGIKVLAQSTKLENSDVFVSAREEDMGYALGKAAGQFIKDRLNGSAEVAILNYPDIPQIIERENGIKKGILEVSPDAKVVATQKAGTTDQGLKAAEIILQAHPNVKVFCGINDAGALGALNAVEAAKKGGDDVFIGGVDAIDQALEKISEGGLYRATIDTDPLNNGRMDVDLVKKLLDGEKVDPVYNVEVKTVTKDNIKQ
jgi:ribose transport system substrate-binding protein